MRRRDFITLLGGAMAIGQLTSALWPAQWPLLRFVSDSPTVSAHAGMLSAA
jgi:hypothetical protein